MEQVTINQMLQTNSTSNQSLSSLVAGQSKKSAADGATFVDLLKNTADKAESDSKDAEINMFANGDRVMKTRDDKNAKTNATDKDVRKTDRKDDKKVSDLTDEVTEEATAMAQTLANEAVNASEPVVTVQSTDLAGVQAVTATAQPETVTADPIVVAAPEVQVDTQAAPIADDLKASDSVIADGTQTQPQITQAAAELSADTQGVTPGVQTAAVQTEATPVASNKEVETVQPEGTEQAASEAAPLNEQPVQEAKEAANAEDDSEGEDDKDESENHTALLSGASQHMTKTSNVTMESISKAAEAAPAQTMNTTEATMVEDLKALMQAQFPGKDGVMNIVLNPEGLGRIAIQVTYQEGHAAVALTASNPQTLQMLSQNAADLAQIIANKTGQETQIVVPQPQNTSNLQSNNSNSESANKQSAEEQQEHAQQNNPGQRGHQNESFMQMMRLGLL